MRLRFFERVAASSERPPRLPAVGPSAPQSRRVGQATRKWLLLVEDNSYDEALTMRAFRKNGFDSSVVVARDGIEALNRVFGSDGADAAGEPTADTLPHLVLLDLQLPRLDGFEVLRCLRAQPRTRLVPVVILSSSLEREDVARSYELGANSYIRKPVDFSEFVVTASQLGDYWFGLNRTCPPPFGG
jgi:two-component system response regulator